MAAAAGLVFGKAATLPDGVFVGLSAAIADPLPAIASRLLAATRRKLRDRSIFMLLEK
jgi:hypothetical protein